MAHRRCIRPLSPPAEAIADIEKVTAAEVVDMANTVKLCGVFTLLPEEETHEV